MPLSYRIDSLDNIEESQKALYVKSGDGYQLDVDGLEDVTGLKNKRDELLTKNKALQKKAQEQEEEARQAKEAAAKKAGDIEALEASLIEKYESKQKESQAQIDRLNAMIREEKIDKVAADIANEISTMPKLLGREIKDRLTIEEIDGKFQTRILDAEGKLSALTIDELKKEFIDNNDYAGIIKGSKASGGQAATGGNNHGSGSRKWADYDNERDLIDLKKSDPDEYKRLLTTR
ncbi:hypothetical protein AB832_07430 [Flavobacteriaceae bacterium (ex Bugula neritina AB1)]|nr:hypothetical protein AB832_07430 [Flavobacteriaceae bacterium (ex Bugula neritina AB1)]